MVNRILFALLVSAFCIYAQECDYFSMEQDKSCYQQFEDYPTFASGERYKINESVCFHLWRIPQPYKDTTIKGVPVHIYMMYRPCKAVLDIVYNPDNVGKYKYVVYYSYETTYDLIQDDYSFYGIRTTPDIYYENDVIEIFRKDGSLLYRGRVKFEGMSVSTSGDCYNKTGSVATKHTNNASTCK